MKTFAVRIYDNTANTMGHESMTVTSYENLETLDIRDCNDVYGMKEAEAEALKAEYEKQIADKNLEWASVDVDYFEFEEDED